MGIQGLTTLMENQFSGWERKQVNGRLVFDGYSVCHQIHEDNSSQISWSHGGQYGQFRTATLGFIDCLLHSGISPVFVFDGIDHKQQKAKVILKRRKEWIDCIRESLTGSAKKRPYGVRILPLLAIEVFQDAMRKIFLAFISSKLLIFPPWTPRDLKLISSCIWWHTTIPVKDNWLPTLFS